MPTPAYLDLLDRRRMDLRDRLATILPVDAAFTWEIGCGHGHFLTAYAAEHPDKLCIGIDLASERIERAQRKRDRAKLKNLHFVQAEARLFLEALPESNVCAEIFVLFPDPWPKLRHNKHRIIQPSFLDAAAERATTRCPLYFRTDHAPYFESAVAVIQGHARWSLTEEPWPFEFATVFQQRAPHYQSLIARRAAPKTAANA